MCAATCGRNVTRVRVRVRARAVEMSDRVKMLAIAYSASLQSFRARRTSASASLLVTIAYQTLSFHSMSDTAPYALLDGHEEALAWLRDNDRAAYGSLVDRHSVRVCVRVRARALRRSHAPQRNPHCMGDGQVCEEAAVVCAREGNATCAKNMLYSAWWVRGCPA